MLAIGLDIGTTGLCASLLDAQSGRILKTITKPNNFFLHSDVSWEKAQDSNKIFSEIKNMLDGLFCEDIGCIGVTGQMHGILYLDKAGSPVSPLYTWQDGRSGLPYKTSTYAEQYGAPIGYGLATDYYNRINGLIPPEAALLCTIHAFTAMRLCSESSPLLHSSDAASLGQFDIENSKFTVSSPLLPEVTGNVRIIGTYRGAAVCCAIGDNQAGFIGSVKDGGMLINVGTGSQVSIPTSRYVKAKGLETRPLDGSECILVGSALCGGRAFALLESFLRQAASLAGVQTDSLYPALDQLLADGSDTDLCFDTRFCGTRNEPDIRASVTNLSESNFTVRDFSLALLNGMADELISFAQLSGVKPDFAVGAGNGIRKNPALLHVLEKRLGCCVLVPSHCEEASYGAALSALYACGFFTSLSEARGLISYK